MNQTVSSNAFDEALRRAAANRAAVPQAEFIAAQDINAALIAQWQALEDAAAEANIFNESRVLPSALVHCDSARDAGLFLLWDGRPRAGRLIGLMPLALGQRYGQRPVPHWQNWLHPNAFLGNPLVADGQEQAFWTALLAYLDRHARSALFFHLDYFALDGPTALALRKICAGQNRRCDIVRRHERAFVRSNLSGQDYYERAVRAKKRKELRRQKRRLEEIGTLAFHRSDGLADLDGWIDAFLALEASGWKGQGHSALASQKRTRALFRDMLGAMAAAGRLELLSLRFEGAPIAMLVNLQSGSGIFSFKTTFDEAFARFSPGVLLQIENYALLDRPEIVWADSCAAPDHPMIDSLWTERRSIGRVSVAVGGQARRVAFTGLRWIEDRMAARQERAA